MKMLCVKCDEPMAFKDAEDGGDSTAGLIFACGKCGNSFAMLINQMEAQLVRSLGVHVGGRKEAAKPMEVIKDTLLTGDTQKPASILWDKEAEERLQKVPVFVRPMVRKGIENYAVNNGHSKITTEVMNYAKKQSGM